MGLAKIARFSIAAAFAVGPIACLPHVALADPVVFAAASLKNALDEVATL